VPSGQAHKAPGSGCTASGNIPWWFEDGPGYRRRARFSAMKIPSRTGRARAGIRRRAVCWASSSCRNCPATGRWTWSGWPATSGPGPRCPWLLASHQDHLEDLGHATSAFAVDFHTEVAEELTDAGPRRSLRLSRGRGPGRRRATMAKRIMRDRVGPAAPQYSSYKSSLRSTTVETWTG
jgi:hypothetical protein